MEASSPYLIPTDSGPFHLEFQGHDSEASYDAEAGYPGAMREFAHRWHIHRDTINRFDEAFSPWLEKASGIPRKIDDELTARRKTYAVNPNKVTPLVERPTKYWNRVIATLKGRGETKLIEEIKEAALFLSKTLKVAVAPAATPRPVAPMFFKRADSLLCLDLDTLNGRISRFQALVPDFELARDQEGKPVRESLARLLQKFSDATLAQDD